MSTSDINSSTCDLEESTCDLVTSACDLEESTCDLVASTCDIDAGTNTASSDQCCQSEESKTSLSSSAFDINTDPVSAPEDFVSNSAADDKVLASTSTTSKSLSLASVLGFGGNSFDEEDEEDEEEEEDDVDDDDVDEGGRGGGERVENDVGSEEERSVYKDASGTSASEEFDKSVADKSVSVVVDDQSSATPKSMRIGDTDGDVHAPDEAVRGGEMKELRVEPDSGDHCDFKNGGKNVNAGGNDYDDGKTDKLNEFGIASKSPVDEKVAGGGGGKVEDGAKFVEEGEGDNIDKQKIHARSVYGANSYGGQAGGFGGKDTVRGRVEAHAKSSHGGEARGQSVDVHGKRDHDVRQDGVNRRSQSSHGESGSDRIGEYDYNRRTAQDLDRRKKTHSQSPRRGGDNFRRVRDSDCMPGHDEDFHDFDDEAFEDFMRDEEKHMSKQNKKSTRVDNRRDVRAAVSGIIRDGKINGNNGWTSNLFDVNAEVDDIKGKQNHVLRKDSKSTLSDELQDVNSTVDDILRDKKHLLKMNSKKKSTRGDVTHDNNSNVTFSDIIREKVKWLRIDSKTKLAGEDSGGNSDTGGDESDKTDKRSNTPSKAIRGKRHHSKNAYSTGRYGEYEKEKKFGGEDSSDKNEDRRFVRRFKNLFKLGKF